MGWIDDKIASDDLITAKMLYERFGFRHVIGITLHARQAIAGPICVASTILSPHHKFNLKSAHKLGMDECQKQLDLLNRKAPMVNLGWASVDSIYKIGMHRAIMTAINTCLSGVSIYNPASIIIVDGFNVSPLPNGVRDSKCPIYTIKNGKERVDSIMAASIAARVARSHVMAAMHKEYPEYGWDSNEGFATKQHLEKIKEYGISPYHRDLSSIKSLTGFEAFPNERWRKRYETGYYGE